MKTKHHQTPLVSVIITVYNQAEFITQAVKSVQSQSYQNFEIIIVNDCSQDNSLTIVEKLALHNKRIKVISNDQNEGCPRSMQIALTAATGKYVAKLDGDDFWIDNDKLTKQVAFLENHADYVLISAGLQVVNIEGDLIHYQRFPAQDPDIRKVILRQNVIASPAILFRRDLANQLGGFPTNIGRVEDLALWLAMGQYGKFHICPEIFSAHRLTGLNIGETGRRQQLKDTISLIKKYANSYPNYNFARVKLFWDKLIFTMPPPLLNLGRAFKRLLTV